MEKTAIDFCKIESGVVGDKIISNVGSFLLQNKDLAKQICLK